MCNMCNIIEMNKMDFGQAKGKLIAKTRQIKVVEGCFAVQSQTAKRFYFVDFDNKCTCPDFETRNVQCKHVHAVCFYKEIIKRKGSSIQIEKTRITYKQDWGNYNEAQENEVILFDKMLKDLVADIPDEEYEFG